MIGYLEGTLKELPHDPDHILVLTRMGVGYEVAFKMRPLPNVEALYISTIVRETGWELFGFQTYEEKTLFELLLTVNGVGPKSASAIVHHLGVEGLTQAVMMESRDAFRKVPGVGPKTASQLLLDLKDKLKKLNPLVGAKLPLNKGSTGAPVTHKEVIDEAFLAFKELGWSEEKVWPCVQKIMKEQKIGSATQLVQQVLKLMS